jgi:Protein of unknown function (DUF1524)
MSARAWFGWGGVGVAGLALALAVIGGAMASPSTPTDPAPHPTAVQAESSTPAPTPATPTPTAMTPTTTVPTPTTTVPTPTTTVPTPTTAVSNPAPSASALAAVDHLTVKGRAPKTGYSREQFGQAWFDADRNGCDTRNDILGRDLVDRQMKNWCKVLAGTRSPDPYTGRTIRFVVGGPSEIDVDHVVALADAWQKGAATWPPGIRRAFANDPLALLAVDSHTNRSKGDGDAATWLPPNRSYRCAYVARQVAVKAKYGLWVTAAERDAMVRVLSQCPGMPLPGQ